LLAAFREFNIVEGDKLESLAMFATKKTESSEDKRLLARRLNFWHHIHQNKRSIRKKRHGKNECRRELIRSTQACIFCLLETHEYPWSIDQSPKRFLKGFMTQSSFLSLEESARIELSTELSHLFSENGKPIPTEFISTVYLARRL